MLATLKEAHQNAKEYSKSLDNLRGEFCYPFSCHFSWCHVPCHVTLQFQELQLELIDLQWDNVLREKYNSLELFYALLN